jgi:hypothetical protein
VRDDPPRRDRVQDTAAVAGFEPRALRPHDFGKVALDPVLRERMPDRACWVRHRLGLGFEARSSMRTTAGPLSPSERGLGWRGVVWVRSGRFMEPFHNRDHGDGPLTPPSPRWGEGEVLRSNARPANRRDQSSRGRRRRARARIAAERGGGGRGSGLCRNRRSCARRRARLLQ